MASKQTEREHHPAGDPYSSRRPIPTIPRFFRERKERAEKREKQQAEKHRKESSQEELFDPITQRNVEISDINYNYQKSYKDPNYTVPNQSIQAGLSAGDEPYLNSTQSPSTYKQHQDDLAPPEAHDNITRDVPISDEKTNILFFPTPAVDLSYISREIKQKTNQYTLFCFLFTLLVTWVVSHSILLSIIFPIAASCSIFLWMDHVHTVGQAAEWGSEQKRGEYALLNLIPESAEWMNHLLEKVWDLINPELFSSMIDQIEDVMQASIPSFIENVRIASFHQGSHPVRVISIRSLPADETRKTFRDQEPSQNENKDEPQQKAKRFYNLEVCAAYHAMPVESNTTTAHASNIHLRVVFYPGIKGTIGIPLPIWVEMKGFVARIRLRCELMPEIPFLKNVTFSLMGLPQINVAAVPVAENGLNVLGLPLISKFVNDSIAAAANEYVSPKNMTLDMSKILLGDDIKKETNALGVLYIYIEKAEGLSKQDVNGLSDAYITIGYYKFGKPLYCTRVIKQDLNPMWKEHAVIPVFPEHIKAGEKVSVELWDSDRFSPDDVVGRTKLDLHVLLQNPEKMMDRCDTLTGISEETSLPGHIYYSIGYFSKADFREELRTGGHDISIPRSIREDPDFQRPQGTLSDKEEDAVVHTPPDSEYPCGILSFTIHQAVNLEISHPKGTYGKVKGTYNTSPPQEVGDVKSEEGGDLPSSYVCVDMNDALTYKTRTKVYSSNPIYNAGSEKFVKDWRNAIICFTVRNFRLREHDSILGTVNIPLAKTLTSFSQLTKWYPIEGGIGFGSIRLSILFRSVKLQIPRNLSGWDIGTLAFIDTKLIAEGVDSVSKVNFSYVRINAGMRKSSTKYVTSESPGRVSWMVRGYNLAIPLKHRYGSALVFEFRNHLRRKNNVYAILWLSDLVDNEETTVRIPIFVSTKPAHILQNTVNIEHPDEFSQLEILGYLTTTVSFRRGLGIAHENLISTDDEGASFETFMSLRSQGKRKGYVRDMSNPVYDSSSNHEDEHPVSKLSTMETADENTENETEESPNQSALSYSNQMNGDEQNGVEQTVTLDGINQQSASGPTRDLNHEEQIFQREFISLGQAANGQTGNQSGNHKPSSNQTNYPTHNNGTNEGKDNSGSQVIDDEDAETLDSEISGDEQERKQLHRDDNELERRMHRGIYNYKAVRTGNWVKDGAKMRLRSLKKRFSLDGREPDVETEIAR
ncbi:tricalbin, C2 domain protein (phospholipid binding) ER-plasma membrane tethering protein Tcb2 [Schizosaccharomyces osmophilus]|uniref:Tricalbin, C2 domain protein (Phospholipid binding) ER-plasma membrane tethering protein Tcb2 n=1 Tax=Schizosaccharomyces osmophilus TaxID=2545709 RepID=A0AAF0AX62_9SCHI|nr:tricalbin, C2 domain protein (phospholipid binding) ER-plasma membrane tethering protein Tcb2 [Schizosaccharomyces osmophilus]WBW75526.1 tricalbin, C2 domain protein (phospholipid binding) ER-plasma membrane tethering protein Tcb2 [Schizosaccharomyces osmophilus]